MILRVVRLKYFCFNWTSLAFHTKTCLESELWFQDTHKTQVLYSDLKSGLRFPLTTVIADAHFICNRHFICQHKTKATPSTELCVVVQCVAKIPASFTSSSLLFKNSQRILHKSMCACVSQNVEVAIRWVEIKNTIWKGWEDGGVLLVQWAPECRWLQETEKFIMIIIGLRGKEDHKTHLSCKPSITIFLGNEVEGRIVQCYHFQDIINYPSFRRREKGMWKFNRHALYRYRSRSSGASNEIGAFVAAAWDGTFPFVDFPSSTSIPCPYGLRFFFLSPSHPLLHKSSCFFHFN